MPGEKNTTVYDMFEDIGEGEEPTAEQTEAFAKGDFGAMLIGSTES